MAHSHHLLPASRSSPFSRPFTGCSRSDSADRRPPGPGHSFSSASTAWRSRSPSWRRATPCQAPSTNGPVGSQRPTRLGGRLVDAHRVHHQRARPGDRAAARAGSICIVVCMASESRVGQPAPVGARRLRGRSDTPASDSGVRESPCPADSRVEPRRPVGRLRTSAATRWRAFRTKGVRGDGVRVFRSSLTEGVNLPRARSRRHRWPAWPRLRYGMPSYMGRLSARQLNAVTAYLYRKTHSRSP